MRYSPLSPHGAEKVDLPGRHGPLAALHAPAGGDGTRAPAVVLLLPGYTGSKEDFAPLLDPLADAGFEVVAIDLPGQYESPGPAVESEYLPAMLGAGIVELVEKLVSGGKRLLLLGHSFGGLVARGAVLGGAPISGLTLLDSGPYELPEGERRSALVDGEPVLRARGMDAAWQGRLALNERSARWRDAPSELRRFEREVFFASAPAGLLGMGRALLEEPDLTDALAAALRASGVPGAVVCGADDDAWSPATQREMAARLGASFHTVAGARHSPNTENPEELLSILVPLWSSWARPCHK